MKTLPRRAAFVVLVAVAALAITAGSGAGQADDDEAADRRAVLWARPLPEHLVEPPPLNEAARLLLLTRRSVKFCDAMVSVAGLEEPAPADFDALYTYASSYYGIMAGVDFEEKVEESASSDEERRVALPTPIVEAVLAQQVQMYGYMLRVSIARNLDLDQGDRLRVQREVADLAFLQLVNSSFIEAETLLVEARSRFC